MEILFVFVVLFVAESRADIGGLEPRIKFPSGSSASLLSSSLSSSNSQFRSLDDLIDFNKYHHYNDLTDILKFTNKTYANMVHLYSIGKSVQGRELWVMKLSTTPNELFTIGKPSVKLVANIHGNEPVGRELLLHLMKYILMNYESNAIIRNIIDNTDVHLLFSMNPDGFENAEEGDCDSVNGRYNMKGVDLNRNFPDFFKPNRNIQTQPEAHAIMQWLQSIPFSLSASLHGGALVASYPYDNKAGPALHWSQSEPSISPDDDTFRFLSLTYSKNNHEMRKGEACTIGDKMFPNGITNGADWYLLTGGMQDYNYVYHGCMELTLELSCCKYPKVTELENHWNLNSNALFDYIRQVHRGVYGTVSDVYGYPVLNATLYIRGRKIPFRTNSVGEFRRILLPGKYVLEVFSPNYKPTEIRFAVEDAYQPTTLQVVLEPGQVLNY